MLLIVSVNDKITEFLPPHIQCLQFQLLILIETPQWTYIAIYSKPLLQHRFMRHQDQSAVYFWYQFIPQT